MLQSIARRSTRDRRSVGRAPALQLAELPAQEAWQGPMRSPLMACGTLTSGAATTHSFEQVRKGSPRLEATTARNSNEAYLNPLASYDTATPGEASTTEP